MLEERRLAHARGAADDVGRHSPRRGPTGAIGPKPGILFRGPRSTRSGLSRTTSAVHAPRRIRCPPPARCQRRHRRLSPYVVGTHNACRQIDSRCAGLTLGIAELFELSEGGRHDHF